MRSGLRTVGAVIVLLALAGAAAGVQAFRETRYPAPPAADDSMFLTDGVVARRLTVGYNALAADLYWIRMIQYYGDTKLKLDRLAAARGSGLGAADGVEYKLLYPLLDLTTSLDPRFNLAYRFGAIFLAETYPGGAGRPDLAIKLLEKGLRARPDKWEYMQDIGFVYYWWLHDFKSASTWFEKASLAPGGPWFLRSMAAVTLASVGDRRASRTMWEAIRQSAESDWIRQDADRRLMQLDAMDFIASLQPKVDRLTAMTGEPPHDWTALIKSGVIPGVPADATHTPYEIEPSGRVILSPRSTLYPLPEEPPSGPPTP